MQKRKKQCGVQAIMPEKGPDEEVKSQSDNENASKRPQLKAKMNIKCDGKKEAGKAATARKPKSRAKTENRGQNYARLEKPAGSGKNSCPVAVNLSLSVFWGSLK